MASQSWVSLINAGAFATGPGATLTLAASTQVASPVTGATNQDVAVVNGAGQPLGWYPGLVMKILARGYYTSSATTGTLTYKLMYNKANSTAIASQTAILATNGITTQGSVVTGMQWRFDALVRCTAIATSGNTVAAQGELQFFILAGTPPTLPASPVLMSTAPGWSIAAPNITGETATAVDTTQLAGINLSVTGTAAQGTLACTQWIVEALD